MVVSLPPILRTAALACSARLVVSRAFCTPCSVHLHSETYVGINPPPRVSVPRSTSDYKRVVTRRCLRFPPARGLAPKVGGVVVPLELQTPSATRQLASRNGAEE